MDLGTIIGMVVGITVVVLAILSGSDASIFINTPGLLIVVGGTFASTLIKFPVGAVFSAIPTGVKLAFVNEKEKPKDHIKTSLELADIARKKGLIAIEDNKIQNVFFKKGVQMCVDDRKPDYIRMVLTQDMAQSIQGHEISAKIFESIGDAAPAFGMVGTLVGLVQMLASMSDPASIGPAMAVALLTTLYGVLIANLIALPISDKLKDKNERDKRMRSLIIECVFQIQQKSNSTTMLEVLETHLPEKQRSEQGSDSYTAGKEFETRRKK
jgi:chemotaxis protein MotA